MMERRRFLSQLGIMAAGAGAARLAGSETAQGATALDLPLPLVSIGPHQVTRLVVGSNPINGYSYLGPHTDRHMKEYFTPAQTVEFLLACQQAGINTHQFSTSGIDQAATVFQMARDRGLSMHLICLSGNRQQIKPVVEQTRPVAVVHHGGVTDRLFSEGKSRQVLDFVKAVHDEGLLAGVSAHNPECIARIADEGWKVDFFMTCFYFLTRKSLQKSEEEKHPLETLEIVYPFYRDDPLQMTRVIRQVEQPCLAFKILAAGRLCANQEMVREAFRFAFEHIKPIDGVIVGMYPRFFDEVSANAQYVRQFGTPSA